MGRRRKRPAHPFDGLSDPNLDLIDVAQGLMEDASKRGMLKRDPGWHREFMAARRLRNQLQAEAQEKGAGEGPAPKAKLN